MLYGVLGVSTQLANILLLPFLTRLFTIKEYGVIELVTVAGNFANIVMTLCISSGLLRFYYEEAGENRKKLISTLFWFVVVLSICVCIILMTITPSIVGVTVRNKLYGPYFCLGWIWAAIMAPASILNTLLRAERRIVGYGLLNILLLVTNIGFAILLVGYYNTGIEGVFVAMVLSSLVALIVGLVLTRNSLEFSFSWNICRGVLSYSLPQVPAVLTGWVNQRGTRYIITFYMTLSAVGIYGVGVHLAAIISFIVSAFQKTWSPYVMKIMAHESFESVNRKILSLYVGGCVVISLLFLTISREVCVIFLDEKYLTALPLLPWLMGGVIIRGSGNITSIGISIRKKTSKQSVAAWIGVVCNIIVTFMLIPIIGMIGAAISFFCAELITTIILARYTYTYNLIRFEHKTLAFLFISYLAWSQGITLMSIYVDSIVLRYCTGLIGAALIIYYLNIFSVIIQSVKKRLTVDAVADI